MQPASRNPGAVPPPSTATSMAAMLPAIVVFIAVSYFPGASCVHLLYMIVFGIALAEVLFPKKEIYVGIERHLPASGHCISFLCKAKFGEEDLNDQ